jgi:hypothetical protein
MQDELAAQMIEQLRAINESLKAIVKRLDRMESAMKNAAGDEELVLLPRTAPSTPTPTRPPGSPPIIESRVSGPRTN